jgi:hypothetical protein
LDFKGVLHALHWRRFVILLVLDLVQFKSYQEQEFLIYNDDDDDDDDDD